MLNKDLLSKVINSFTKNEVTNLLDDKADKVHTHDSLTVEHGGSLRFFDETGNRHYNCIRPISNYESVAGYGMNYIIGGGQCTILGGGESIYRFEEQIINNPDVTATENLILTSDSVIRLFTGMNSYDPNDESTKDGLEVTISGEDFNIKSNQIDRRACVLSLESKGHSTGRQNAIEFRYEDTTANQSIMLMHNIYDGIRKPFGLHVMKTDFNTQQDFKAYLDVEGEIYSENSKVLTSSSYSLARAMEQEILELEIASIS